MAENLRDWTLEYAKPMIRTGLEHLVDAVTPGLPARLASDPAAHDEHIAALGLAANEAEALLADAVLAARASGRTWSQIADALDIDRATAQARFSGNSPAITQLGAALIVNDAAAVATDLGAPVAGKPAGGGPAVGEVRRVQPFKWGKVTDLDLLGSYGWQVTHTELNQNWTAGVGMATLDNQQWEYGVTSRKKKAPAGVGWEMIDGAGIWAGAIYWRRATGKPVRPGNPEPSLLLGGGVSL